MLDSECLTDFVDMGNVLQVSLPLRGKSEAEDE